MKKFIIMIVTLSLIATLAACGGTSNDKKDGDTGKVTDNKQNDGDVDTEKEPEDGTNDVTVIEPEVDFFGDPENLSETFTSYGVSLNHPPEWKRDPAEPTMIMFNESAAIQIAVLEETFANAQETEEYVKSEFGQDEDIDLEIIKAAENSVTAVLTFADNGGRQMIKADFFTAPDGVMIAVVSTYPEDNMEASEPVIKAMLRTISFEGEEIQVPEEDILVPEDVETGEAE